MDTPRQQHAGPDPDPDLDPGNAPGEPPSGLSSRLLGPLVFGLSVVCAFALWSRRGHSPGHGAPGSWSAPALPDTAGVQGWAGSYPVDGQPGATLEVRLSPLHADPPRQLFDARAMADHLALGAGEPWRLVVTYHRDSRPEAQAGSRPGSDPAPGSTSEGADLSLAGWRIVDAEGGILRPIVEGPLLLENDGVSDPLRCLLAAPASLAPGEEVAVVFWGTRPGSEPCLEVPFADRPWSLAERSFDDLAAGPALAALARLDGRTQAGRPRERGGEAHGPR